MAERISLYILKKDHEYLDNFKETLEDIKKIHFCKRCFNVSERDLCSICEDDQRDLSQICVLESAEDVITVERTGKFKGYYHILQGLINPLNNVLPDDLKIMELLERVRASGGGIKELILAINHTVEGDATALYLASLIKDIGATVKISRLAKGLPTGSDIRYADEITLGQAIIERKEILQ